MVWTLRRKILIGYSIFLALTIVVFLLALFHLLKLGRATNAILSENYKSILAAENMIDAIERQDSAALLVLLGYDQEGLTQYRENESQFLQWLARAKDNITIEGEKKIIASIDQDYSSYLVQFSRLIETVHSTPQKASAYYHETMLVTFKRVRNACIDLREINSQTMFQASDKAQNIAHRAIISMTVIGFVAVIAGLGFSLLLSNLLVKPLRSMLQATKQLAEGRYDVEVTTSSSDELGHLAHEFNTMARKLKAYHDLNIWEMLAEKRKSAAIIRSIDDGIIVVDSELRVTNINPAAAKVLEIEPEKVQNKHFLEVVKNEQLFEYVKSSIETGAPPKIEEHKNIFTLDRCDVLCHFQFSITPMQAQGDSRPGIVLLLRDVTKLKELDRLKSEFVMAASHELRTPLMSMGMSIDLLLEKSSQKLDENEQQLLEVAHEELQRLKVLVNNLLDLSKIEAGKMQMELGPVPVGIILEKAVAVLKTQAESKTVELSFDAPKNLPRAVADANKITWVLTNLISNALRYTKNGGHIQLFARLFGSQIHISVRDDGSGIPYEYQSTIFDKFVQVKGDKTPGGSGLGLAICKEIVRAHGGSIWVESIPGEGSTFTFTLPIEV